MPQRLPSLTRHRLGWTPWRFLRSANTHGTTGAWTSAVNTGTGVEPGYHQAIEHLKVFGGWPRKHPRQPNRTDQDRLRDCRTGRCGQPASHGSDRLQRAKALFAEEAIQGVESASLSTDDRMNTLIAVLNKINPAGMMAVRASQDTNQSLVTLAQQQIDESKRRPDAEAAEIADHIAFQVKCQGRRSQWYQWPTIVPSSFQIR